MASQGEPMEIENDDAIQITERRRKTKILSVQLGCGILQLPVWGIAMTFGIWQDEYAQQQVVDGPQNALGTIGTTMNGVMYLSMPIIATLLVHGQWAHRRRSVALIGAILGCTAFLLSSWSTQVWHLLVLQGLLSPLGNAMLYVPSLLWLDEWFHDRNRSTAYGIQFSIKNIVGTVGPFLMQGLLTKLGFRNAIRIWSCISFASSLVGLYIIPVQPVRTAQDRPRTASWAFLKHETFYICAAANLIFSSGYGLPQTYLPVYASQVVHLSPLISSLTIVMFNLAGILSSTGFALLSDRTRLSASNNTAVSAIGSAVCVFVFWALKSNTMPALLIVFSIGYGFFASGYSATWGGWIEEIEKEAAHHNEPINSGMVYGFMNGARGIGFVVGGLSGSELLGKKVLQQSEWALGTEYGALMLFTGISAALGGWSIVWKACHNLKAACSKHA